LTFELKLWYEISEDVNRLPDKTRRIIKNALKRLENDPYPGRHGDKEKLVLRGGVIIYRLHISHRYTAFYTIDDVEKLVIVEDILTTEQAHKKYGYY